MLRLLAHFGEDGKPETVIAKVSHETLAEMIGTTRSRVSFFMNSSAGRISSFRQRAPDPTMVKNPGEEVIKQRMRITESCHNSGNEPVRTERNRTMNGPGNSIKQWPGQPYPLGATWDGTGVNFALFSEHATDVELCSIRRKRKRNRRVSASLNIRTMCGMPISRKCYQANYTAIGCMAPTSLSKDIGSTPTSC